MIGPKALKHAVIPILAVSHGRECRGALLTLAGGRKVLVFSARRKLWPGARLATEFRHVPHVQASSAEAIDGVEDGPLVLSESNDAVREQTSLILACASLGFAKLFC